MEILNKHGSLVRNTVVSYAFEMSGTIWICITLERVVPPKFICLQSIAFSAF